MHTRSALQLMLFLFVFPLFTLTAADTLPAFITSDLDLGPAESPHFVPWDVQINAGVTVNILPGTVILMDSADILEANGHPAFTEIIVKGTLNMVGTPDSLISFTSNKIGYGTWGQIRYDSSGTGVIRNLQMKYASTALKILSGKIDTVSNISIDSCRQGIFHDFPNDSLFLSDLILRNIGAGGSTDAGITLEGEGSHYESVRIDMRDVKGVGIAHRGANFTYSISESDIRNVTTSRLTTSAILINGENMDGKIRNCLIANAKKGINHLVSLTSLNQPDEKIFVDYTTIVGCEYGIFAEAEANVTNSIIVNNDIGMWADNQECVSEHNNVWGNDIYSYGGFERGEHDVSIKPLFVDKENGDYTLQSMSPLLQVSSTGGEIGAYGGSIPVQINNKPNMVGPKEIQVSVKRGSHFVDISFPRSHDNVQVWISDVKGRTIRNLSAAHAQAPRNNVTWDYTAQSGKPVNTGVYVIHVQTKRNQISRRVFVQ